MNYFNIILLILTNSPAIGWTMQTESVFENPEPSVAPPFDPHKDNFTLASLSSKTWDGPYYQEILLGSSTSLPCAINSAVLDRLFNQRHLAMEKKYYWSILWVHKNWDTVVDPWMGDGRRRYDTLQVVPYWEPNANAHINQASLKIIDTNPTDNGVYACVVAMYPPEKGFAPVILSQTDLVSVHFLRIKSDAKPSPMCPDGDDENNIYCLTGFEPWTHHVYLPSGNHKGPAIFHVECQADIFLTALAMGGVDPTFWSIGWRFVPKNTTDDTDAVEIGSKVKMQFHAPVHECHPGSSVPCVYNEGDKKEPRKVKARDLDAAHELSTRMWRARWLVLTGTEPQISGKWQCWIQGLAITSHPTTLSLPILWFIDEVHTKIISQEDLYTWWTTQEFWRVLGLITAPTIVLLIGLIMAVGRTAAFLHPEKIPARKQINLLLEPGTDGREVRETKPDQDSFDPYTYMNQYLGRQGVDSYQMTGKGHQIRVLFR